MTPPSSPVQAGDVLAGKYRVERVLGAGGMGIVVAATHLALDEKVALKFLLGGAAENPEVVARFLREARAAAKIRSEHVARVTDVGTLESGAPYLVMEYLDGQDLSERVATSGPLPVEHAVEYVLQACEALAEAHVLGIVHRDLKPANLFLTHRADGTPSVKVLDFGISKMAVDGVGSGLTKTAGILGSPLYMSPEQLQSTKDVDARTDVWSLGVILYELLAGAPPFIAETMPQLVMQIMSVPPRPMSGFRADVPAGLVAAIEGALQKDRTTRLPDVVAFAVAVAPFGGPRALASAQRIARVFESRGVRPSVVTPPPEPVGAATLQMTTGGLSTVAVGSATVREAVVPQRSRRLPIAIGAIVFVLSGVTVGILAARGGSSDKSLATPAEESPPALTDKKAATNKKAAAPEEPAVEETAPAPTPSAPAVTTAKAPPAVPATKPSAISSAMASTTPKASASSTKPEQPKPVSTGIQIE